MSSNPARRAALVDAAIEVLATTGARGLTFRAVDTAAGVPVGTASNYFTDRDDLLNQAGHRVHLRVGPDPDTIALVARTQPGAALTEELLHALLRRVLADRVGALALLELRLEATRRPRLRAALTDTIVANLAENVRFHLDTGLPGDRTTVVLLYLALGGLITEALTLPEVFDEAQRAELVRELVARTLPRT